MPRRRTKLQPQRLIVVALIGVVFFLVWDRMRVQQRLSSPDYLVELANGLQEQSDTGQHAQMILETRALAKEGFLRLDGMIEAAAEELASLKPEVVRFDELLEELRTNDQGQRIAADRTSLEQLHAITQDYDLDPLDIKQYEQTLAVLREPVDTALTTETFEKPPAPELEARLQQLLKEIRSDAESLRVADRTLQALLSHVPADVPAETPALSEALVALEQQWAELDAAAEREAREEVREQYRAKLAEQQAAQEREKLQAELENKQKVHEQQMEADKLAAEAEAARIAEATEDARRAEAQRQAAREAALEAEAKQRAYQAALPEIRKYLTPFTTPGHKQLVDGKWTYTEEELPLSLGAIQGRGALVNSAGGHMNFYGIAAYSQNDRPTAVFHPGYIGGAIRPSWQPDVVKAQNLLKEHGDMLVENGLLLP